jgi:hypothetical protein
MAARLPARQRGINGAPARARRQPVMKLWILVLGSVLVLARVGAAEVNCKQVKKYLDTGRSVQDVAETMVISEADVKNCQDKLNAEAAQKGDAGAKKDDAASAPGK